MAPINAEFLKCLSLTSIKNLFCPNFKFSNSNPLSSITILEAIPGSMLHPPVKKILLNKSFLISIEHDYIKNNNFYMILLTLIESNKIS